MTRSRWSEHSLFVRFLTRWAVALTIRVPVIMLTSGAVLGTYGHDGPGYWTVFQATLAIRWAISGLEVYTTSEEN